MPNAGSLDLTTPNANRTRPLLPPSLTVTPGSKTPQFSRSMNPATPQSNLKNSLWYQWRSVICSVFVFGTWGIGLLSTPLIPMGSWTERILTACGWTCFATGVFLRVWATLYIGGRKSKSVICEGPYSISRNPLYWGTFMVVLSQAFFYHNLVFTLGLVGPIFIYLYGVIPAEERHLTSRLGEEYLAYCEKVPRIGPRFSSYQSPSEIVVNIKGLRAEATRILGWIWLPILAQVLNALRESAAWPHLFNLP